MKLSEFGNGIESYWGFSANESESKKYLTTVKDNDFDLVELLAKYDLIAPFDPFLEVTGDDEFEPFQLEMIPFAGPDIIAAAELLRVFDRPKIVIDWDQLDQTPEAVRFQLTHQYWECNVVQQAYEIGRFITRKNEVGIIRSIQTEISFEANDIRWPRGDSAWMRRNLGADIGQVDVQWCVKVQSLPNDDENPRAFRTIPIVNPAAWLSEIPGITHPEIEPWNEMLFLWGTDHYVRLRCPASSLVSLWVYRLNDLTPDDVWAYAGMMKGFTQVVGSDRTYENMTRIY